jgi:hypothetical protein
MKKQAYQIIALLVLTVSLAVAAQAQTAGRTQLRATIPFEFNVGEKTMPAGEYTIVQINPSSDQTVLQLRSNEGRNNAMIQMHGVIGKAGEKARLVFNRYGSQYYFSQAWTSADANGWQAPKSKTETLVRQELANRKPASETIALSAR